MTHSQNKNRNQAAKHTKRAGPLGTPKYTAPKKRLQLSSTYANIGESERKHTMKQFLCLCHGLPAYEETDHKIPFWVCEIDDRACEVIEA